MHHTFFYVCIGSKCLKSEPLLLQVGFSYNIDKVLDAYKKEHVWKHKINTKLIPNVAPTNPDHPYLDVFQLTNSCNMENCSYDGGHRSRYVNRWKAQLLLNTLCEYSDVDGNGENSTNKY